MLDTKKAVKKMVINPWIQINEFMDYFLCTDKINGWEVKIPKGTLFLDDEITTLIDYAERNQHLRKVLIDNLILISKRNTALLKRGLVNSNAAISSKKQKLNSIDNPDNTNFLIGFPFHFSQTGQYSTHYSPTVIRKILHENSFQSSINDLGDIIFDIEESFQLFSARILFILKILFKSKSSKILLLGGDHLITPLVINALSKIYSKLNIIVFDAHHDAYCDASNNFSLTNANILPRMLENKAVATVTYFGIRNHIKIPQEILNQIKFKYYTANDLENNLTQILENQTLSSTPTYVSLDIDVLDPEYFEDVNYVERNGISIETLEKLLQKIAVTNNIICSDIVEYAFKGASELTNTTLKRVLNSMLKS